MKPLIYVAGPYTHPDPILNTRLAIQVAEEIIALGGTPVVPHLTLLWHLIKPKAIDEWYDLDLDWLAHCYALVRFKGESVGADREVAFAKAHGIPVYFGTHSLVLPSQPKPAYASVTGTDQSAQPPPPRRHNVRDARCVRNIFGESSEHARCRICNPATHGPGCILCTEDGRTPADHSLGDS